MKNKLLVKEWLNKPLFIFLPRKYYDRSFRRRWRGFAPPDLSQKLISVIFYRPQERFHKADEQVFRLRIFVHGRA
jgi:hypothetical protein